MFWTRINILKGKCILLNKICYEFLFVLQGLLLTYKCNSDITLLSLSLEKINFGYMCVCFLLGHYVYFRREGKMAEE